MFTIFLFNTCEKIMGLSCERWNGFELNLVSLYLEFWSLRFPWTVAMTIKTFVVIKAIYFWEYKNIFHGILEQKVPEFVGQIQYPKYRKHEDWIGVNSITKFPGDLDPSQPAIRARAVSGWMPKLNKYSEVWEISKKMLPVDRQWRWRDILW